MSHANRGKAWEQYLELFHARYERQGRAVVIRTPPPMRILRSIRPGQFLAVYEKEGPPDYLLFCNGIAIMLEAKECKSNRWGFQNLHAHQGRRLDDWQRQGGMGAILLRHHKSNTAWILPWANLGPVWNRWLLQSKTGRRAAPKTASIGEMDFMRLGIPFDQNGYLDQLLRLRLNLISEQEAGPERRPVC